MSRSLVLSLPLIAFGACSSTPEAVRDPKLEAEERLLKQREQETLARQENFPRVMTHLSRAMSEYVTHVAKSQNTRAEKRAGSLRNYLDFQSKQFKTELLTALESDTPRYRAISAAALGFTNDDEVLAPLLNRLGDEVDYVRTNACLGIGTLKRSLTPLDSLNKLALSNNESKEVRQAATWALLQLQEGGSPSENFEKLWPEILAGDPLATDPILAINALRGVGMLRQPAMLQPLLRYFSHPQPLVRQAALIAAARCKNRDAVAHILPFLAPTETNPNVRLTARKALKALTGDRVDHEYDVKQWRKEFGIADPGR